MTKDFREFIENGIVKKQSSNNSRAEFLIEELNQSFIPKNTPLLCGGELHFKTHFKSSDSQILA